MILKREYIYIVLIILIFSIVYAISLTLVYVEGDDATTMAYHVLGRNPSLQPPYGAYNGMMDCILGLLPNNEPLIRKTAIILSGLSAISFVIITMILVYNWLGNMSDSSKLMASLVILMAIPELFYLGLFYNPSLIAISCVLGAHLIIRIAAKHRSHIQNILVFIVSVLLFGFGVACRWDIGFYGFLIVADLVTGTERGNNVFKIEKNWLAYGILWGFLAVGSAIGAIYMSSGAGIGEILGITEALVKFPVTLSSTIVRNTVLLQSLFTPASILLITIGIGVLLKHQKRLIVLCVAGLLPETIIACRLIFQGTGIPPKLIIPAIPVLVLLLINGFNVIWYSPSYRIKHFFRIILFILLVLPWVVGVQVHSSDTSWGPGFELRTPKSGVQTDCDKSLINIDMGTRALNVKKWRAVLGDGLAMPTAEGPRAMGGHGFVLLGGGWRSLVAPIHEARKHAVEKAIALQAPILQIRGDGSYIITQLAEMGYKTNDPFLKAKKEGKRRFFNNHGHQIDTYDLDDEPMLFEKEQFKKLYRTGKFERAVIISTYSSIIRKFVEYYPEDFKAASPFTSFVNIKKLINVSEVNTK